MNFNFAKEPEHDLNSSLVDELISLYGIKIKLIIVERVNEDKTVFGDFSHLLSDRSRTFEIFALPENMEDFNKDEFRFTQFGLDNFDTLDLFIHKSSIESIPGVRHNTLNNVAYSRELESNISNIDYRVIGNLIVLPSGKIMEVTDQSTTTPGINNMFVYKNQKTVYKLTCVQYKPQLVDELDALDRSTIGSDVDEVSSMIPNLNLEKYFDELSLERDDQDFEAEVHELSNTVVLDDTDIILPIDTKIKNTIIDDSEMPGWDWEFSIFLMFFS